MHGPTARRSRGMRIAGRARGRLALVALAAVAAVGLAGCDETEPTPSPTPSATAPSDAAPTAAPVPDESDLGAGFDERPDTTAAPDASLSAEERTALLRVPATAAARPDACTPEDVEVRLWGYDAGLGSRWSALRVENVGATPCTVAGYPGFGARGTWGSAFQLLAEQEPGADPADVLLQPGAAADAPLRWTGDLAGAETEWASMLVVQLAQGQDAVAVEPTILAETMVGGDGGPPHDARIDIGMLTTVRLGAFVPVP